MVKVVRSQFSGVFLRVSQVPQGFLRVPGCSFGFLGFNGLLGIPEDSLGLMCPLVFLGVPWCPVVSVSVCWVGQNYHYNAHNSLTY